MHTTIIQRSDVSHGVTDGDIRIHHNSDWSGAAILQCAEGEGVARIEIPGWAAKVICEHTEAARVSLPEKGRP